MQINTQNRYAHKSDPTLLHLIHSQKALIIGVSESNGQINNLSIMRHRAQLFKDFKIEDKIRKCHGLARFFFIIDKNTMYKRQTDFETTHNACIVTEVKNLIRKESSL